MEEWHAAARDWRRRGPSAGPEALERAAEEYGQPSAPWPPLAQVNT